jgi:hypothetical protein
MKKNNQKKEIIWNIVNSLLAGGLVFLGGCTSGQLSLNTVIFSLVTGAIAAIIQFKDYWANEKPEYSHKLFKFL